MSKVFISHSHQDKALTEVGHEVLGVDSLSVGENISKALNELLHAADVASVGCALRTAK